MLAPLPMGNEYYFLLWSEPIVSINNKPAFPYFKKRKEKKIK